MITRYNPADLDEIEVQPMQTVERITPEHAIALQCNEAFTARSDDGEILICAGALELWEGRALCWALLSAHAGPHMLEITRAVKRYLRIAPFHRLEVYVDSCFGPALRWAHMLGFQLETPQPMRGFLARDRNAYMFSRVR